MKLKITAKVARGENVGTVVYPHLYGDGTYVVSKTRFARDYIHVADLREVAAHIGHGYSVRMSNPKEGVTAARLVAPVSISVTA